MYIIKEKDTFCWDAHYEPTSSSFIFLHICISLNSYLRRRFIRVCTTRLHAILEAVEPSLAFLDEEALQNTVFDQCRLFVF